MKAGTEITILSADLYRDGVLIVFDDGNAALFPASFLFASLPHATEVILHATDAMDVDLEDFDEA